MNMNEIQLGRTSKRGDKDINTVAPLSEISKHKTASFSAVFFSCGGVARRFHSPNYGASSRLALRKIHPFYLPRYF